MYSIPLKHDSIDSTRKDQLVNYLGNPPAPEEPSNTAMQLDSDNPPAATLKAIADSATTSANSTTTPTITPQQKKKQQQQEAELKDLCSKLPEADVYVSLLVVIWLIDHGNYDKVYLYTDVTVLSGDDALIDAIALAGERAVQLVNRNRLSFKSSYNGSTLKQTLLLLGEAA